MFRLKVLVKCPNCGEERWVFKSNTKKRTFSGWCKHCYINKRLEMNHKARRDRPIAGRTKTKRSDGYVEMSLPEYHWCYPMASKTRHSLLLHRLIMAEHLGRLLKKGEIVHHINGIRDDNRAENLELTTLSRHELSYRDGYTRGFKNGVSVRDENLEKQIKLLRWQVKELNQTLQLKLGLEFNYEWNR